MKRSRRSSSKESLTHDSRVVPATRRSHERQRTLHYKEYPAEVVRGTFFEHDVPLSNVFVHFRMQPNGYARPVRPNRVKELVAKWDRQAVGVLLLSLRPDGKMAVIDGSHRVAAAMEVGVETMDALVYIDLSIEEEAKLYRQFGDYLNQSALDKFHAGLTEGIRQYQEISAILVRQGLHIPNTLGSTNGAIDAVDALINISTTYGNQMLQDTLALLCDAWGDNHRNFRSMILRGTAAFLIRFQTNPNYTRKRLIRRMQRNGMPQLERMTMSIREGSMSSNSHTAWGQALLALHDSRSREGYDLGDWVKRHITEQNRESKRENLEKVRKNLTPEQKNKMGVKAGATKRGFDIRAVACEFCGSPVGDPCVTFSGKPIKYYHLARREDAQNGHKP
jgi:hypothetical protein